MLLLFVVVLVFLLQVLLVVVVVVFAGSVVLVLLLLVFVEFAVLVLLLLPLLHSLLFFLHFDNPGYNVLCFVWVVLEIHHEFLVLAYRQLLVLLKETSLILLFLCQT